MGRPTRQRRTTHLVLPPPSGRRLAVAGRNPTDITIPTIGIDGSGGGGDDDAIVGGPSWGSAGGSSSAAQPAASENGSGTEVASAGTSSSTASSSTNASTTASGSSGSSTGSSGSSGGSAGSSGSSAGETSSVVYAAAGGSSSSTASSSTSTGAAPSGSAGQGSGGKVAAEQAQDEPASGSNIVGYFEAWDGARWVLVPEGQMFIEGRGPRAGQQILVVPPLPENFVRGLNMAGATAGLVGNGLEAGGAAALAVAPEPLSKLGAVLLGLVAVDGAQANVRTLKNWGEPTPSFLNQGVTALASQIANPQEARVMGGIVDGGVHLGAGIYSATKVPILLQRTPGLKVVAPANVEAAAGETSAVAKLEPVVAAGETAVPHGQTTIVSAEGTPVNPIGTGSAINIYGAGEASGFTDFATEPRFALGRPLTSVLPNQVASDIALRDAPLSATTLSEMARLAKAGARITYSNADVAGFERYVAQLRETFPNARVVLQGTVTGAEGQRGVVVIELSP
jgi:hypothetical protein